MSTGQPQESLEEMSNRFREMEKEAQKLKELHQVVENSLENSISEEQKQETDLRSVHIGNVDYSSTPEELQAHFQSCGTINRVTIIYDKFTGHPKGKST